MPFIQVDRPCNVGNAILDLALTLTLSRCVQYFSEISCTTIGMMVGALFEACSVGAETSYSGSVVVVENR